MVSSILLLLGVFLAGMYFGSQFTLMYLRLVLKRLEQAEQQKRLHELMGRNHGNE
jgi:hypothetical protein